MGYGEVTGNGSVHWKLDHERRRGIIATCSDKRPTANDPTNVHIGEVVYGRDAVEAATFVVRLRYRSKAEAVAALEAALRAVRKVPGSRRVEAVVLTPCVPRRNPDSEPADVRVDWKGPKRKAASPRRAGR